MAIYGAIKRFGLPRFCYAKSRNDKSVADSAIRAKNAEFIQKSQNPARFTRKIAESTTKIHAYPAKSIAVFSPQVFAKSAKISPCGSNR
ncbi:hypothetical protein [Helicobacter sp. 23-1045]